MDKIKFINIRPWWLRLSLLLVVAFPIITGYPISLLASKISLTSVYSQKLSMLASWLLYAVIVWLVVLFNAGLKKGRSYLFASFVLAAITGGIGFLIRKIIPGVAVEQSSIGIILKMAKIMLTITIVVPYSIMFIHCFSAKGAIESVSTWKGLLRVPGLHFALSMRIFQHAGEVVFNLTDIWLEEFPNMWKPDYSDTKIGTIKKISLFPVWIIQSLNAWIFACIVHTFEPIPIMVAEVEMVSKTGESISKSSWNFVKTGVVSALTALATISTIFIKIPIPATNGYFNIGDTFVIMAGLWLGPIAGFLVGAIGPTLADAIGYPAYVPATFITKGLEGLLVGLIAGGMSTDSRFRKLFAATLGAITMVAGYFIFEAYVYPELGKHIPAFAITDVGAAFVAIGPNLVQGIVGAVGGYVLWRAVSGKHSK